jgi:Tfp pilus assembly protein PilN
MNAVNLLPEKNRPRRPSGGKNRSSYVALGILGSVLVAMLVYVLTLNSINTSKTNIDKAKADATRLDAEANSLGAYGDFAKIKAERVKSVQSLAQGRFDWERLVRELAHVLPSDVWLVNAAASATPIDSAATPAAAPAATGTDPNAAAVAAPAGPTLTVDGCARDQADVAVTLVRLRELQGAEDVSLEHSTQGEDSSASGPSTPSAPAAPDAGAGDGGCGSTNRKPNYAFQATVSFAAIQPTDQGGDVPHRLGGGS